MKNTNYCVIAFNSTHHAIKGEKLLEEKGIDIKTIPTPREITASCGLSIRFDKDYIDKVKQLVNGNNLNIKGIYEVIKTSSCNEVVKLY